MDFLDKVLYKRNIPLDQKLKFRNIMNLLNMLEQIGITAKKVANTHGGEYHSACPSCGGTDRFFLHPYKQMNKCMGSYKCRKCETHGDAIEFARKFLHYSFPEAVELVTGMINLPSQPQKDFFKPIANNQRFALYYPPAQWIEQANKFIEETHQNLLSKPEILQSLHHRGIPLKIIKNYKFGWNNKIRYFEKNAWGIIDNQTSDNNKNILWIPQGIVIPVFDADRIIRLKIRRSNWNQNDKLPKYIAVSGSMNGLNIIGSQKHPIAVVVESELDAYAIEHATGDQICAIAVGSNIKNPDNITDYLARKATKLLICHDNDIAGQTMLNKWKNLYSHAISYPTPIGKDIGEAIIEGLDLRSWLLQDISL